MFPAAPFLSTLLHRVKAVVRRVAGPVAARVRPVRAGAARPAAITPELRSRANGWMRTRLRALSALMRRIERGERLALRVRPSRAARGGGAAAMPAALPPEERLPRGFGWMCAFGPDVRQDGAAFAAWLSEPPMRAMALAEPERMARVIGPILTATGERKPDWFPAASRRVKRSLSLYGPEPAMDEPGSSDASRCDQESCGFTPSLTPSTRDGELVAISDSCVVPRITDPRPQETLAEVRSLFRDGWRPFHVAAVQSFCFEKDMGQTVDHRDHFVTIC